MSESSHRIILTPMVRRLMLGQSLSKTGDTFTQVAMAVFVLKISHGNPAALGLVLAMTYAPRLIMGWAAMGWIDRWNKRRLLLIADAVRALLVLSIAFIHNLPWTLAAVFLVYLFQMFYQPTVRAIQPMFAGSREANRVSVARQEQWSQGGAIIAYISAGILILRFGASVGFVFDSLSYIVSALFILSLPSTLPLWQGAADRMNPYVEQIREGFQYARSHRLVIVLTTISFTAMIGAAGSGILLAPAMERLWHQPTAHFAWALLALSVGVMIGSRLLEVKGQTVELRFLVIAGFFLTGVSIAALVVISNQLWVILIILAISGVGNAMFSTSVMVWLQQTLPIEVRGRVMTLRSITMGLGGVIGSYGIGALIVHSMRLGFFVVGALMVISGAVLLVPWFFEPVDNPESAVVTSI